MMSYLIEAPLTLVAIFPRSGRRIHAFSNFPCPRVVRQLAEAHLALLNTGGPIKSPDTSSVYATAIASFARWLHGQGFDGSLAELTGDTFHAFLRSSSDSARYPSNIKTLIRAYDARYPGSINPHVMHYAQSRELLMRAPTSSRLKPYSASEAQRIEEICKAAIVQLEERLKKGEELLARGADPVTHGITPENLVWLFARHGPIPERKIAEICGLDRATIGKHLKRHSGPTAMTIRALAALLYPTRPDMAAFMVLFGLQTGLSPESIPRLVCKDVVRLGEKKVRIRYRKQRSQGRQADTFSRTGSWSPGQLIKRALRATKRARAFADAQDRDCVWLYMHYQGQNRSSRDLLVVAPDLYDDRRVGEFIAKAGILDDEGKPLDFDLRRLRKTWYARQDKKWHGSVKMIAGVNQSQRVAADHYLDVGEETPAIRNAITETQHSLVRRAEQSHPLVLSVADMQNLEQNPELAVGMADLTPDQVRGFVHSEEEDVFLATCTNFYNSPWGLPGEHCPAAVWNCLICRNAIITPSKLPRIVALLRFIDARFYELPREEWVRRFAAVSHAILKDIKPKFSAAVWAAAEAASMTERLYIPPEETIV